jgi:hypothetical protein
MSAPAAKTSATDNTPTKEQKSTAALEEDDEFEDFPAEGMDFHYVLNI